jgi:hypothetical protein
MNRSAKDGARSSPHYGGEDIWVPLRRTKVFAGDTVGKSVSDSGKLDIVRWEGIATRCFTTRIGIGFRKMSRRR